MKELATTRGRIQKTLAYLMIFVIMAALVCTTALTQTVKAGTPVTITDGVPLYFRNGAEGWGLYTSSGEGALEGTLYTEGKAQNEGDNGWFVSENNLIFQNFHYTTAVGVNYALTMCSDSTLELRGDNSLEVISGTADIRALRIGLGYSPQVTIAGSGSLNIIAGNNQSSSIGIFVNALSRLTISGATVTVTSGTTPRGDTAGYCGDTSSQLVVTNGAQVSFTGPEDGGYSGDWTDSCGMYFSTTTEAPFVVQGAGTRLCFRGMDMGICSLSSIEPEVPAEYYVYGEMGYNGPLSGNTGNADWHTKGTGVGAIYSYYLWNSSYSAPVRYVQIAESPVIQTDELAYGVLGHSYSQTFIATGEPDLRWTCPPSSLPPGLSLSWDGELTGVPTQAGTYTFTVYLYNDYTLERNVRKSFTLTVYELPPEQANEAQNSITHLTGLTGSGTQADPFAAEAGKDFGFTAVGSRQDAQPHTPDDTRYIPTDWSITPLVSTRAVTPLAQAADVMSGTFSGGAPYTIHSNISQAGSYTVQVNYAEEIWDGTSWEATGNTDTKEVLLTITAPAPPPEPTPEPEPNPAPSSDPNTGTDSGSAPTPGAGATSGSPQTGDNSNLPLLALLCGAAALGLLLCGAGIAQHKRTGHKAG